MGQNTAAGAGLLLGGVTLGGLIAGKPGAAIGGLAGGLAASFLTGRGNKQTVHDYQLANSSYGRPIPLFYGSWRFAGNIIWEDEPTSVTQQSGGGGKGLFGGGGSGGTTQQANYQSAAFAFCQGPATLVKVWLDGKLFYDATSDNPQELVSQGKFAGRVYTGTEDQLPDPLISEWVAGHVDPPDASPAYRGICYFVVDNINLTAFGNRMPNFTAVWSTLTEEHMVFQQMIPLATDTSFSNGINTIALSTSWNDGLIYSLNTFREDDLGGTINIFDMRTGNVLLSKTWEQIWSPFPPPAPDGVTPAKPSTITRIPGGRLYIATGILFQPVTVWTLNPNSLQVENTITLPDNPANAQAAPAYMLPFQLISQSFGVTDMLVRVDQAYPKGLVFNPKWGTYSAWLNFHWSGFGGQTEMAVGKQDTVNGTVELWAISSNYLDPTGSLYIYKILVHSDDASAILGLDTELAILDATDFGGTVGTKIGNPKLFYDPADDTIIISVPLDVTGTIKWSPTAGVIWTDPDPTTYPQEYVVGYSGQADISHGRLAAGASRDYRVIDTAAGKSTALVAAGSDPELTFTWSYNSAVNGVVFSRYNSSNNQIWVVYLQRGLINDVPLADVLSDLCQRAGLSTAEIDVSLVTQYIHGYALTEDNKSYGSAVSDLCQAYQIDMVESDYKLKFIPRGQAPVVTITQDELGSVDDSNPAHFWEVKRALEQELPVQINVRYYDPEIDYQTGASYSKRISAPVPTVFSRRVKSVDLPLVLHNAEAHGIAEAWLFASWAERDTYRSVLGQKHAYLDPTDNITVSLDSGETLTVRIEKTELGADFAITLDATAEDIDVYIPSLTPAAVISQTVQTVRQAPLMELLQFNIPLLRDADDLSGAFSRMYFAAGPIGTVGSTDTAQLFESTDGGVSYPLFATASTFASWGYGHSVDILGETPSAFSTDYLNTVTVLTATGSTIPSTITTLELMNGGNVAIVGSEIIQFQTVTDNGNGTVTLSNLLRGRRGTEWATGTHVAGELIVFVEGADVIGGSLPLTQIAVPELWKLVPLGRLLDGTVANSFTYSGFDLYPYAPVNFEREATGSSPHDLTLTWKRRSRLGGGDGLILDGSDSVPLAEDTEEYEVYLLGSNSIDEFDPTNALTYQRKISGITSATTTYTSSMMASDGFDPSTDTLHMVVYQLSAVVGRGFRGYQPLPAF